MKSDKNLQIVIFKMVVTLPTLVQLCIGLSVLVLRVLPFRQSIEFCVAGADFEIVRRSTLQRGGI